MEVLNTTSPTVEPAEPMDLPMKTVPSASARMACWDCDALPCKDKSTGFSGLISVRPSMRKVSFYKTVAGCF